MAKTREQALQEQLTGMGQQAALLLGQIAVLSADLDAAREEIAALTAPAADLKLVQK